MDPSAFTLAQPSDFLREELIKRKKTNHAYSIRAFSRDLGMSQPLLTWVLNGKRKLSLKQAHKITAFLNYSPNKEKKFLDLVSEHLQSKMEVSSKMRTSREAKDAAFRAKSIDSENFRLIARWYHLAILSLISTKDFRSEPEWIAKTLGITQGEVKNAISRLDTLGYIRIVGGKIITTHKHVEIKTETSLTAVRSYHQEMISKALEELKRTQPENFEKRDITSVSLAIDSSLVPEAKSFLAWVREEMVRRFTTGEIDSVYQLNLQFFNVSKGNSHENQS